MSEVQNDTSTSKEDLNSRIYELGYLLIPSIKEEDLSVSYGDIKELVSSFEGEIITDEIPKMTQLAYSMQKTVSNIRNKFSSAYFGWVKFIMDSDKVLKLKVKLDLSSSIIRFLILKTVKENTIASKRFIRGEYKRPTMRKSSENEIAVPINKEEIDKEIDAMVAV